MKRRPGIWLLLALIALPALKAAGCSRREGREGAAGLTPTSPPAFTPLPEPPTPTFIPGYITPVPELPG